MAAMLWDWLLCVAIGILGIVVIFGGSSSIIVIIFMVIVLVVKLFLWAVMAYGVGGDEASKLHGEIKALKAKLELQEIKHKEEQHWAWKENMTIIVTKHGECWHLKPGCQHVQTESSQFLKPCKHCTSTLGLVSQSSSTSE